MEFGSFVAKIAAALRAHVAFVRDRNFDHDFSRFDHVFRLDREIEDARSLEEKRALVKGELTPSTSRFVYEA
jgi:hypothetical protein